MQPDQRFTPHAKLDRNLEALDQKHDAQFKVVFDATCQLMAPEPTHSGKSDSAFSMPTNHPQWPGAVEFAVLRFLEPVEPDLIGNAVRHDALLTDNDRPRRNRRPN